MNWEQQIRTYDRRQRRKMAEIKRREVCFDPAYFDFIDAETGINYMPTEKEYIPLSELERQAIEQDREYWQAVKKRSTCKGY